MIASTWIAAAARPWLTLAIVLVVLSALTLLVIVLGPTRTVREEPPLDEEVESRILLGESPDQIEEELEEEAREREDEAESEDAPGPGSGPAA